MFSLTIFGIVATALASFMVDTSKGMFWAMNKSLISKDVRFFAMRITNETLATSIRATAPATAIMHPTVGRAVKRAIASFLYITTPTRT